AVLLCEFFVSASCWPDRPCCNEDEDENVCPVSGNWRIGAEMRGSAAPLSATVFSPVGGRLATLPLAPPLEFPLEFVAPALPASRSVNWSRRSDSSRPFEVSSWYPERDGVESVYQAVTFVFTRTTDSPDAVERTCTEES